METQTLALSEFLLARIAEDEERARGDIDHFGGTDEPRDKWIVRLAYRALAECEAKRQIVVDLSPGAGEGEWYAGQDHLHEKVLQALALPYADHPSHRNEWRP